MIEWRLPTGANFLKGKYSRAHTWSFDGGVTVPASSAPSSVPLPWSDPNRVDPEEAFVAAVSSCHMLTYLWLAYRAGFQVEQYRDEAVGVMSPGENGVLRVGTITLRPDILYAGPDRPTAAEEEQLHHHAHEQCFIANSINTVVTVAKPMATVQGAPAPPQ
jgi:organic hydroperoxide reductase OsmC/OhrA